MLDSINKKFYKDSLLSVLLLLTIIWQINKSDSYYYWLYNNLIKTNFQFIFNASQSLSSDQKSELKLGKSFSFLKLIKESSPEDAVILFPNYAVFSDASNQVEFNIYMNKKGYLSYFLYPRKVVFEHENGKSKMYDQISHVAIVNNWGYDKINYSVENKIPYSVLPIVHPTKNNSTR